MRFSKLSKRLAVKAVKFANMEYREQLEWLTYLDELWNWGTLAMMTKQYDLGELSMNMNDIGMDWKNQPYPTYSKDHADLRRFLDEVKILKTALKISIAGYLK